MVAHDVGAKPFKPHANNILSGGATVANSTTQTTFLTIPAGRTWYGSVSATAQGASGTSGGEEGNTRVVTAGTGVVPAATTPLAIAHSRRDTAAAAMTSNNVYVVAPAGNAVTLDLLNSDATNLTGSAVATGVLL